MNMQVISTSSNAALPMWQVNKTQVFIRCVEDEEVSEEVVSSIERWASTTNLTPNKRSRRVFVSPNKTFQIWSARLPDPDHRRGTSGGFRLTYFYVMAETTVNLGLLERRRNLGGRNERRKDQQKYNQHIEELKTTLLNVYENNAR